MVKDACGAYLYVFLGLLISWGSPADARTWTDITGKHKVEAELVEVADGSVRLKRDADGRIVTLSIDLLSQADKEFLQQQSSDEPTWKVGDKLYIKLKGDWQLAELTEIAEGSGSAKYVINVQTGDRRTMRVTEKRMRRYGAAGEQDVLLPGDIVEYKSGFKWVTAELVSHDGRWAKIKLEGSLGVTSTPLSNLRPPGAGAPDATVGSTRVASGRGGSQQGAAESGDLGIVYPEPPALTAVSFAGVQAVQTVGGAAAFDATANRPPAAEPPSTLRPLPLNLTPQRNSWDSVVDLSVAERGTRAALLRGSFSSDEQMLELIDLTSNAKFLLAGLPPKTDAVYLSPTGGKLLSKRSEPYALDLWAIDSQGLSHVVSWNPKQKADDYWEKLTAVRWVDDQSVLTSTRAATVLWDAPRAAPKYLVKGGGTLTFFAEGRYFVRLLPNSGGIAIHETATGQTKAVVGAGRTLAGELKISPSGRLALLSQHAGLVELWDLAAGQRVIRTLRPAGAEGIGDWAGSDALVAFGDVTCEPPTFRESAAAPAALEPAEDDRYTTKTLPNGKVIRVPKRTQSGGSSTIAAGRRWTTAGYVLSAAPIPAANPGPAPDLTLRGPFLLSPGGSVAVDMRVERAIESGVRDRLVESIKEQGFRVDDSSPVRLEASTELGPSATQTYRAFFNRDDETTVSYRPHKYLLKLTVNGQERWRREASYGAPGSVSSREGKSINQLVNEYLQWSADRAPLPILPEHIVAQ